MEETDDTKEISEGDIMLLCCWGGYKGCHGEAWGLGKVTAKEEREERFIICYDWKQFVPSIQRATIHDCLVREEKNRFIVPQYRPNWLIKIKPSSFWCSFWNLGKLI